MRRIILRILHSTLAAVILCMFAACARGGREALVRTEAAPGFHPLKVNSVVVLPLNAGPNVATEVSSLLVDALNAGTTLEVLNKTQPSGVAGVLTALGQTTRPQRERAAHLGKTLGAQGVIYGSVTHFTTEEVGFQVWLINPATGDTLYSGSYGLRSDTLTENLFELPQFMETRGRPLEPFTALRKGFEQFARELEALRREALNPQ
jgi:hypothetical protein